jgi:muramoyltetrapeptide carboxypeptidase
MTVLCSLIGTPHLPSFDGSILFLEDINVDGLTFRRMLQQLRDTGILHQCNGIVFGTFENQPEDSLPTVEEVIRQSLKDFDRPVSMGWEFSHGAQCPTFPIGARVSLRVSKWSEDIVFGECVK